MNFPEVQREHTRAADPSPRTAAHLLRLALAKKRRESRGLIALMQFTEVFDCDIERLASKVRRREMVADRHLCMKWMRKCGVSYPVIGQMLGGRDHSSVIHACRKGQL